MNDIMMQMSKDVTLKEISDIMLVISALPRGVYERSLMFVQVFNEISKNCG